MKTVLPHGQSLRLARSFSWCSHRAIVAFTKGFIYVSLAVAAVGVWRLSWSEQYPEKRLPFDSLSWMQAAPSSAVGQDKSRTVRSYMIDDLLRHYRFDGWTRQQVIDLLGEPTGEWPGFEQWDMIYVLGLERAGALSLDAEALGFKFDDRGRVMHYGLSVN